MPIFEYVCSDCKHQFEDLVFGSDPKVECPKCGSSNVVKLISSFAASTSSSSGSAPSCGSGGCGSGGFS